MEAAAAARLGRYLPSVAGSGHQRDRRHHPHQSRTRAAGGGGHRPRGRSGARLRVARVRPWTGHARTARRARRSAAVPFDRRRSRRGGQQQRRGDHDRAGRAGTGPRGHCLSWRARRDRRRVPRPRRHGAVGGGRCARSGRRTRPAQPTTRPRFPSEQRSSCASTPQISRSKGSPSVQPWRTLSRSAKSSTSLSPRISAAAMIWHRIRHRIWHRIGHRVATTHGRGHGRRRRGRVLLQRGQAARRAAGRHHRRPRGARRSHPQTSADARAARRQDDLRGARSDAGRVRRRPRADDRAGAADAGD